jgi:hypothetical protein
VVFLESPGSCLATPLVQGGQGQGQSKIKTDLDLTPLAPVDEGQSGKEKVNTVFREALSVFPLTFHL